MTGVKEPKMLGKPLRKKLKEHKSWDSATAKDSNPSQTWRRNRDKATRAIDDLGLMASKLDDEKQNEIFTADRLATFIESLLKVAQEKAFMRQSGAYKRLDEFRRSQKMMQIEGDITRLVNLEAANRRDAGKTIESDDFEEIRDDILKAQITEAGKNLLKLRDDLQEQYTIALKKDKDISIKRAADVDMRRVALASAIGLVCLEYCNEQMPKMFDPVLSRLSARTSFEPSIEVLQHMYDKAEPSDEDATLKHRRRYRRESDCESVTTVKY